MHVNGEQYREDNIQAGCGMVRVESFGEYAKNGNHQLVLKILSWTVPSEVGRDHDETIFVGRGEAQRLVRLAVACGLVLPKDERAACEGGFDFQSQATIGKVFFCAIEHRAKKDDPSTVYANIGEWGRAMHRLDDPRCKDWPKDQAVFNQHVAALGGDAVGSNGPGRTQGQEAGNGSSQPSQPQNQSDVFSV